MTIVNIDQIVSITIDEMPISRYEWSPKIMFRGISTRKEGVYNIHGNWIGTKIPENHVLIDGCIYERPKVVLEFSNRKSYTKCFNTIEEANEFVDKIYIAKPLKLE